MLAGQEGCDDENTADLDSCSSTCTKEIGLDCTNATCGQTSCTAICGDGLKVGIEACDDGNNTNSSDGCSAVCTVDCGYKCSTDEGVDGASTCAATSCGDGVVAGLQECDDSDLASEDGCSSSCAMEFGWKCSNPDCGLSTCLWQTGNEACGDGFTLGAEEGTQNFCDDGDTTPGDGCSSEYRIECGYECDGGLEGAADTCTARCGNLVKTGDEGCDDGNSIDNDGCSSCAIDDGYSCLESDACSPSTCSEVCGDGKKIGNEACDDNNTAPGDGCTDECTVECGFTCNGAGPQGCDTACGDGKLAGNETCDDGNSANDDGCSADCSVVEAGWTCSNTTCKATTCSNDLGHLYLVNLTVQSLVQTFEGGSTGVPSIFKVVSTMDIPGNIPYTYLKRLDIRYKSGDMSIFSEPPSLDSDGNLNFRVLPFRNGISLWFVSLVLIVDGMNSTVTHALEIHVSPVNSHPNFDLVSKVTLLEDSGSVVFKAAFNISAGPLDEHGQQVTFMITHLSGNASIFVVPPVLDRHGNLILESQLDANGETSWMITLIDDGGNLNGGVNNHSVSLFVIDVLAVNDAPAFSMPSSVLI